MADLKISQLPAAAALTGSELIELVQAGGNVQSTVTAIGAPLAPVVLNNAVAWTALTTATVAPGGGFSPGTCSAGGTLSWQWSAQQASLATQLSTPSATTIGAAVCMSIATSNALTNAAVSAFGSQFFSNGSPALVSFRLCSGGMPIGGFTSVMYFCFTQVQTGQLAFAGWMQSQVSVPVLGNTTVSTIPNILGFGKDTADTVLSLYYNNGSGSATKVSTGMTFASLAGHMLKAIITCDAVGNCTAQIIDTEPVGSQGTFNSGTIPTATAKLPAADVNLAPVFYACTGSSSAAVKLGVASVFTTHGLVI